MKKVILIQLRLTNFKGIRDLTIDFNGTTNIAGANRAGKSTVFDSFCWLLWGKDQFDRKDYEIKTLDENNQPLHQLNHEVEALFLIDGREERPKRIYKEIWTKRRGEPKPAMTGHETVYFWNDVPMKMADYQAKINSIISEGMFKLLTNTLYFNSLPWDKRRTCLLDIAGEITNTEVFNKIATPNNDYGTLIMVLNSGKTAAEYKKEIGVKKLKIKHELEQIPARVDEAERSKPESFDFDAVEREISVKETDIKVIDDTLHDAAKAQASAQQSLMQKQSSLHQAKTRLSNIRYQIQSEIQAEQNASTNNIYQAEQAIRNLNVNISDKEQSLQGRINLKSSHLTAIQEDTQKIEELRTEWDKIDAEEFVFDDTACTCPTCKQMLQQHDIDLKKQEMLGNFNTDKLKRLTEKVNQANKFKDRIAESEKSIVAIDGQIAQLQGELQNLKAQLPSLKTKLDTAKLVDANKVGFDMQAEINTRVSVHTDAININVQIKNIEAEIEAANNTPAGTNNNDELKQQKAVLQSELNKLREKLSVKTTIERTNARITELKRQEETLSQELADHEQHEFEILNYDKARMDILESRINSRFQLVSFKLFNRQINGGEEPCCETLFKGVPYGSLNTEAKINCGLDIINVLSEHYQVSAPIFIDNRESVTNIIPTQSQIINLIVNPSFKSLQVEAAA